MMEFGVHARRSPDPVGEARAVNADLVQVLVGDPQSWKKPVMGTPGGASGVRAAAEEAGVGVYVHSAYVLNVASLNNRIRIPSRKLLQQTVDEAAAMGARGVIVHGGHVTANGDPAVGHDNWRKCVEGLTLQVPILIENTAGGDNAMARTLEAIARTWDAVSGLENSADVGFCLDTCHAHAAGLDLETVVDDILAITGRIDLVHLNNSRDEAGSGADRHAPLLNGMIDPALLLNVAREANTAVILETLPDNHAQEIEVLKEILG